MPKVPRRSNRGPAAAPENRRALIDAARRVFAQRGYLAPLSAIAQEAGVGQGVLYRHFPTRLDLALAVFEQHFAELEAIAAEPDAGAFGRLWSRLLELTVEESAFVEMFLATRRDLAQTDLADRLPALIQATLPRAQAAGLVPDSLTASDVLLVQRMVYGVVATSISDDEVRDAVTRALGLLGGVLEG
ncbi:TetR/AcrR family transcriptional regulator [Cellulomonas fengjieae]|uniref:TetR/AcrR family transcriptional regulator n=1 Tax=Cellulomonas fengjieae TaxID=2819978 RepID=A0ABS3SG26_9CELL|nr:TetR/AcrR family transcriptional regulator [Cellulomonas fengjieae]MBO3084683.1 TetR/AcrR family transcriptional regulator [Cellulomonas fengjieae]MBO3103455.1 TetR/AcrR family transcriptional regulator [Cellulomonas fengjieae]QVI66993.1 TetR/AcrR family transcriptional regulator [Cellulomonas fengjieae]